MESPSKESFSSTSRLLPSSPKYPLQSYSFFPPSPKAPQICSVSDQKLVSHYDGGVFGADSTERSRERSYPRIKTSTILTRLLPILVVNLLLEALFACILKFYGNKKILLGPDRRFFNMTSLLAASAMSMGIGYLLGEIGFMFRGSMLGKSDNTKAEVSTEIRPCELDGKTIQDCLPLLLLRLSSSSVLFPSPFVYRAVMFIRTLL